MLPPVAMATFRNTFADPRERAQAIGVYAAMFGISMALGRRREPLLELRFFGGAPFAVPPTHVAAPRRGDRRERHRALLDHYA
jgi:hypothetical protein